MTSLKRVNEGCNPLIKFPNFTKQTMFSNNLIVSQENLDKRKVGELEK